MVMAEASRPTYYIGLPNETSILVYLSQVMVILSICIRYTENGLIIVIMFIINFVSTYVVRNRKKNIESEEDWLPSLNYRGLLLQR